MRLWDWALEAYARQPVAEACLHLQDAHGQNVPYPAVGRLDGGRGPCRRTSSRRGQDHARWDAEVGAPLRGVRRALKAPRPPVDDAAKEVCATR
jgi:uncharacterized protein (TIGR02444 family)